MTKAQRRQKVTYVTPDGKERHVPESWRSTFDYLITKWDGTTSSAVIHMAYVRDEQWETNLNRHCGRLFYCTDDLPLDVVELLGRLNIDIEKWYATYGCTYAAAAHAFSRALGHLP